VHVLSATGLSKTYDDRTLFEDVSFGIKTGDRIGLVGPNGSGKSTLLQIVAGLIPPDDGEVVHNLDAHVRYLPQEPDLRPGFALDAVMEMANDHTVREHEVEALLAHMGVGAHDETAEMSGGQRRRVAIAAALSAPADLLVLDEPTNHLDVWTVDWLEDQLRSRASALLLVTHDRRMLERLTTRLLELDPQGGDPTSARGPGRASAGGGAFWHEGGYSVLLESRAERLRRRGRADHLRANQLRKEIAWLRRQPKARASKPKFREDQALALQESTPNGEPGQLQLGTGRRRLGSQVIDADNVTFRYPTGDRDVIKDFSISVGPGARLGVVGPNGAGKTTALQVLLRELEATAGEVKHGTTVEIGVYRQHSEVEVSERTVLDTIHEIGTHIPLANGEKLASTQLAERFGFAPRLQRSLVSTLSGGERRRLALLHLLVAAPNVLVLDEPTNDLDLDTLAMLEDHLDGFSGTLIVASHDRFVLDRLTDELLAVEPDGTVTRHMDWERYRESAEAAMKSSTPKRGGGGGGGKRKGGKAKPMPTGGGDDRQTAAERKSARRKLQNAEAQVAKLSGLRDQLDAALAAHGSDQARVAELAPARHAVATQLAAAEEAWLGLAAHLEDDPDEP
jgi:ATP-binding cassette subfamily F protein uup